MNGKSSNTITFLLLFSIFLVFLCAELILNLTPPISRDALIHHLAIPKLWIRDGRFFETPWMDFSYYPMMINLLYLVPLYFHNDVLPKFIHLAFGLGTGTLIYFYLRQEHGRNWGLLGLIIFFTTPIIIWLSTSAYIDLGMTFFTTGSVLSFVKWRDLDYKELKWLFISAICMGIAIGSKYNALIAMLFLNMMLIQSYAGDTKQQITGLKYGLLFFLLATLVASPWYLKNYFLTGNPFYPLFNSFFTSLSHQPTQGIVKNQIVENSREISFFIMRKVMYGETFLETFFIPIRMFFQGDDNNYQYFQGVLNPILIVFSPFTLLNKRHRKDKILFAFFAIFFILMAYFLTAKQVRYLVPALPLLSILSVMGIKDLSDRFKAGSTFSFLKTKAPCNKLQGIFPAKELCLSFIRSLSPKQATGNTLAIAVHKGTGFALRILLFAIVITLLIFNLLYLNNRLNIIKPLPYVLKQETREDFLKRHLPYYDAVAYINAHLPDNATVFTMFLGRRGYYLERAYKNEPSFGYDMIDKLVGSSMSEERFRKYIHTTGITHILMRTDFVDNYLRDYFSVEEKDQFMNLVKKCWKIEYSHNFYAVWNIKANYPYNDT